MAKTTCPACDVVIVITDPRQGAFIRCPLCDAELEIVATDPLEVYPPFDDEYWDDEYICEEDRYDHD